jgi:hypothetical protein
VQPVGRRRVLEFRVGDVRGAFQGPGARLAHRVGPLRRGLFGFAFPSCLRLRPCFLLSALGFGPLLFLSPAEDFAAPQ